MQPQVTAALIAAIAALVVAVISLTTTLLNQRAARRTNQELERFKDELARAREKRSETLQAQHAAIRGIQKLKDAIQLILEAAPGSLPGKRAVDLLQKCREQMISAYEEHLPRLASTDAQTLHNVKNAALSLEMLVRPTLIEIRDVSKLPQNLVNQLRDVRQRLTTSQEMLRDSLTRDAASS